MANKLLLKKRSLRPVKSLPLSQIFSSAREFPHISSRSFLFSSMLAPRLPPPAPISPSGRSPPASPSAGERIPPQQMVSAATRAKETTPLVGTTGGKGLVAIYDYDLYDDVGGGKTARYLLLNFWGSVIAVLASTGLIGCTAYFLKESFSPSALFLSCIIGAILATLSLTMECSHLLGWPRFLLLPLGQHAMFHLCVASFGIPAFLQGHYGLGALFALHLVPSLLFFVSRARREPSPKGKR